MVAKKKAVGKKRPVMTGAPSGTVDVAMAKADHIGPSWRELVDRMCSLETRFSLLMAGVQASTHDSRAQALNEQAARLEVLRRRIEAQLADDDQVDAIRHGVGHGLSGGSSTNDYEPKERFASEVAGFPKSDRVRACNTIAPAPGMMLACDRLEGDLSLVMELVQVLVNRLDPVLRPSDPRPTTDDCYESSGVPLVDRLSRSSQNLRQVSETLTSALSRLELP